jgi:Fur family transcriptional regulator, peroxide stress response regulator
MRRVLDPLEESTKGLRLEDFERHCRDRGMPRTKQRRVILKAVLDLDCHPTADEVHASPEVRRARISRATVYRTLESLASMGFITKACHPGGVVRYDGRIEMHHHLICLRCEAVIDIADPQLDALHVPETAVFGFRVEDFRVQLRGVCRVCQAKEEAREDNKWS